MTTRQIQDLILTIFQTIRYGEHDMTIAEIAMVAEVDIDMLRNTLANISTFWDAGVMTHNLGVQFDVRGDGDDMPGGDTMRFQITVVA